jgi:hypothetical protein
VAEFIFMLTRDDETVDDARAIYASVADSGVTHFGCKDIGLPRAELEELIDEIRADGHTSYLEVVSETVQDTLRSARVAAEIRPDYLIGGTVIEPILEIIDGTGIRFFPYVGRIVGHPCLLRGTLDEVAADAREAERLGADGVNLLAYRYDRDVDALVQAVVRATSLPVIAAGSVDSTARIEALSRGGVWGFTVGTAALDGEFVPGEPLGAQLAAILQAASSGSRAAGERAERTA